uniref:Uncharacterized protein n=1 Tax=Cairina moschata TaxID=8855 RepID=A0A8C3BA43_CAIMO
MIQGPLGDTSGHLGDPLCPSKGLLGATLGTSRGPLAMGFGGIDLGALRALNFTLMETDCAPGSRVPADDCDFKENGVRLGGDPGGGHNPAGTRGVTPRCSSSGADSAASWARSDAFGPGSTSTCKPTAPSVSAEQINGAERGPTA